MLKHPSGPHTPSPLPSPSTPKPWGDLEFTDCQRSLTIWHPHGPCNILLFVFEGSVPRGPLALHHRVWRKVRGAKTEQKHRIWETCPSPVQPGWWERLLCSLCNCVAKRLPRSCLCVSPGQLRGGGDGGRVEGAPRFISKVLHLCDGVGWGGNHWCYRSRDAPPSGQQMFLSVQSLFLFFVFFFPCGWGLL